MWGGNLWYHNINVKKHTYLLPYSEQVRHSFQSNHLQYVNELESALELSVIPVIARADTDFKCLLIAGLEKMQFLPIWSLHQWEKHQHYACREELEWYIQLIKIQKRALEFCNHLKPIPHLEEKFRDLCLPSGSRTLCSETQSDPMRKKIIGMLFGLQQRIHSGRTTSLCNWPNTSQTMYKLKTCHGERLPRKGTHCEPNNYLELDQFRKTSTFARWIKTMFKHSSRESELLRGKGQPKE